MLPFLCSIVGGPFSRKQSCLRKASFYYEVSFKLERRSSVLQDETVQHEARVRDSDIEDERSISLMIALGSL